ncbi:MAG TPA: lytic polysaccharide monooxygenase [Roseiflexaceae bacterium]|nr:lytic polysaccharide monooxygenase [Roseiflexaceae bacterium]
MDRRNRTQLCLALLMVVVPILIALTTIKVPITLAHGSMQNPISRYYACYLEGPESPDSVACREAITAGGTQPLYDWNEVNISNAGGRHREIIPDGKLCSAGRTKYAAYDQPRSDWATTIMPSGGQYTFLYNAYVPHNQGYFEFYVTRDGFDPATQALKWSDLEPTPFLRSDFPPLTNGYYVMTGQLPANKSGRHIIYSIWQRLDSQEAFYACSDVWFGTASTPTPTPPPACTAPAWSSTATYATGDTVSYGNREWRARWGNSGTTPSSDAQSGPWQIWRYCQSGGTQPTTGPTTVPTRTPTTGPTATPTRTPTTGPTTVPTRTPTTGPTAVPTATPSTGTGACSPVTSTVTAPFSYDGAGTFCWRTSSLGSYVNSWNVASLTINGVDFTNRWGNAYPPAIGGYYYISYSAQHSWSHFETR